MGQTNKSDRLSGYLKVALLHHHPYLYSPRREVAVVQPGSWFSREGFLEMRGALAFLGWCAGRHVSLVLHGHRHVPRFNSR